MRIICTLGLVGFFVLVGGCASHHTANNDEQIDLYLNTLDDKHFVWCELDLEQCRNDFEKWKVTARGRRIIEEFEQENTSQTDNTQHLPNVFRTRFVEEGQLAEEMLGEQGKKQRLRQDSIEIGGPGPSFDEDGDTIQEEIKLSPRKYGP